MFFIKILDASHWVRPEWAAWLKAGFIAVYLKVAEGRSWEDVYWKQHHDEAEGFFKGAYLFFHGYRDGGEQAQWFYDKAKVREWDMKPVVDVEWLSGNSYIKDGKRVRRVSQAEYARQLKACLLKTEELWGEKPMIYTSRTMWRFLIGFDSWFAQYDLWTAHYTMALEPWIPAEWNSIGYRMWQYIDRPVDQNRWKGSKADFLAWMGKAEEVPDGPTVLAPGVYEVL